MGEESGEYKRLTRLNRTYPFEPAPYPSHESLKVSHLSHPLRIPCLDPDGFPLSVPTSRVHFPFLKPILTYTHYSKGSDPQTFVFELAPSRDCFPHRTLQSDVGRDPYVGPK